MRSILNIIFITSFVSVLGCTEAPNQTGAPVATTQEQFEAYDAMIAEDQAQTALDEQESSDEGGE